MVNIAIVQDRPVFKYQNKYYRLNLSEFDKYLKLCDHLLYCASIVEISEGDSVRDMCVIDSSKVTILSIRKNNLFDKLCLSKFNIKSIQKAVELSDLVVIKMPSVSFGSYAIHCAKAFERKYILEVVGCAWDSFWYHSLRGKFLAPLSFLLTKIKIHEASYVLYVTSRFLQDRYPTIGNSIGCSNVFIAECDRKILEKRLEKIELLKLNGSLKIGTTSPVDVRFRGQEYVIKAIAKLKKRGLRFDYYMAGGGNSLFLKKLSVKLGVKDQVHFLGKLSSEEVNHYLDNIDIYIHPSKAEGLPRALIEAMSRGVPSLGSRTAGIPELLPDTRLFGKGRVDEIALLLQQFTVDIMKYDAIYNYEFSKNYWEKKLMNKRKIFYSKVLQK